MPIQDLLKETRRSLRLTQKETGSLLDTSGSLIAQYETGVRVPKPETLRQMVNVFISQLPVSQLPIDEKMSKRDRQVLSAAAAPIIKLSQETSMLENVRGITPDISGYEKYYSFWSEELDVDFFPGQWHYVKSSPDVQPMDKSFEILQSFYLLNDEGKQVAIDRVHELTEIKRYTVK